jgi:hypothetical protein
MTGPVLELLSVPVTPPPMRDLTIAIGAWCLPAAVGSGLAPDARLAFGLDARGLDDALADPSVPVAVWMGDAHEPAPSGAIALVADTGAGVDGNGAIAVPNPSVDVGAIAWRPPFVRERWRRRNGLPEPTVVTSLHLSESGRQSRVTRDALALASAVVVTPPLLLTALAFGAPAVVFGPDLPAFATDGVCVTATDAEEAEAQAHALAADATRAARLSAAGRRLVESRFDIAATARTLAFALGLAMPAAEPWRGVAARLAELGTPASRLPSVRHRVGVR